LEATAPLSDAPVQFTVNDASVSVPARGSLLDALREELGLHSVKDGCSPQGQCGSCTVWVDGQPRVSCVTPVTRVRGRHVTTIESLPDAESWAQQFAACGATQCGFCTPGIIMRAAAMTDERRADRSAVEQMLLAHQCRCTGWQPIVDAVVGFDSDRATRSDSDDHVDLASASRRATLEGGVSQSVGSAIALGRGGFADDTAPAGCLVAVRSASGEWVVGETLDEARRLSGKVQGRRTSAPVSWAIDIPEGDWDRTLQTTWVEPAYVEPDASWCKPGGEPMSSHGNGGAFGGKADGVLGAVARRLADEHGRAVRVLNTREDVVRLGPKRPPLAIGVRSDGGGVLRVAATLGVTEMMAQRFPAISVEQVTVNGPPTSLALRGAVWAEVAAVLATMQPGPTYTVTSPAGATASATVAPDGAIAVEVACGDVLSDVVLRSYCVGAAHMALGLVTSEALSVDADGVPHDLTMRSFGVLRAVDTPPITVAISSTGPGEPTNGSDAVFAAVAGAVWAHRGLPTRWPDS
jgi:xanthine dehydrogenase small subunit